MIFIWTLGNPVGYHESQRTMITFYRTKGWHLYVTLVAQHFHALVPAASKVQDLS